MEEIKRDPDTKAPVLDQDGKAILEEKEIQIPMFKIVSVFDVSQTEGKPLPQLASDLKGNVQNYEIFMEALRRSSPVPMKVAPIRDSADGFFNADTQSITIREGMSEVQTVSAAVHEITHAKLHNYEKERLAAAKGDETKEPPKPKDRRTEEVEAESVSYSVCQYYGIQTGENSFGYIASWSKGKELQELKASLDTINKTASSLIHDIDTHFAEICKERGIDLTVQTEQADTQIEEPEHTPPEPTTPAPATENFRITDDALGEGSLKTKFRMNMEAIRTLQAIEAEGRSATAAEQEILSRYVGWGSMPDAFDENKTAWADEYAELKSILSPEEYA